MKRLQWSNGTILEYQMENGNRHGYYRALFQEGTHRTGYWKSNVPVGEWTTYRPDGSKKDQVVYRMDGTRKERVVYNPDGSVKRRMEFE